ncbi:TetR/AcrR family transcriptional regulator [Lentzea sp. NPDC058436]|uniref:TetR/AcrR family transcriptional regulator n=1 Tax=Lentzea sp. NPDC058436 TaxID=3346499 RepID=UPI00364EBBA0
MASSTREQILEVTATLLSEVGAAAVSIRDVCQAAGVTAPTVYHHFGDRQGLLEAVAAQGFERYLATKQGLGASADALDDLRAGWDRHVEFGLTNPASYQLMYGPTSSRTHASAQQGLKVLHAMLVRLAQEGRLSTTPDEAVPFIHSACVGTTLTLLSDPANPAHRGLSDRVRDAIFAAIITGQDADSDAEKVLATQAGTLLATLAGRSDLDLSPGERLLLTELLTRLT